jgi:cytochrome c biogenesis protein CcmG/thiol:disulfide interchange protein DsbE
MYFDRRSLLLMLPLGAAVVGGIGVWAALERMQDTGYDPRAAPTALSGKKIPAFHLPGIKGPGFSSLDLATTGFPVLVNFFASWCPPCAEESPLLLKLQKQGVAIWGIAYKDIETKTTDFLDRHGNPYRRIGSDEPGRTAIDWGMTSVPESFLVDGEGYIRWHLAGPLSDTIIARELMPALAKAKT